MATPIAEAIQKRNEAYIDHLPDSLGRYLSYLSTMSRFHKYKAEDIVSFALEAPSTFTAVAAPSVWEKHFGRKIDPRAKGVSLIRNGEKFMVYDVTEAVDSAGKPGTVNLWQYDDGQHKQFFDAVVPGDFPTEGKVRQIADKLATESAVQESDREVLAASIAAVVLERLNLDNDEAVRQLAALSLKGRDIHAIIENTQVNSQKILDAMQKSVAQGIALGTEPIDLTLPENNPLLQAVGRIEAVAVAEENLEQKHSHPTEEISEQNTVGTTQDEPTPEPQITRERAKLIFTNDGIVTEPLETRNEQAETIEAKEQHTQADETPAPQPKPNYREIDGFEVGVDEEDQIYAKFIGKGSGITFSEAEENHLPFLSYEFGKWQFGSWSGLGASGEESRDEFVRRANEIIHDREKKNIETAQKQVAEVMTAYENHEFADSAEALRRLQNIRLRADQNGVSDVIKEEIDSQIERIRKDREEKFAEQERKAEAVVEQTEQTETAETSAPGMAERLGLGELVWQEMSIGKPKTPSVEQNDLFAAFDEPTADNSQDSTDTATIGESENSAKAEQSPPEQATSTATNANAETREQPSATTATASPPKDFQAVLASDEALIRGNSREKNAFRQNVLAIRTLKHIEAEKRPSTEEEQEIIRGYVGFGGIPKAFDADDSAWSQEAKLLESILTKDEYAAARASVLNAHYTPNEVIQGMYAGLAKMGFEQGTILEPSMGVGRFFGNMPEGMKSGSHLYGVELDSLTGRMAKALYPEAEISIKGFEKTTYLNDAFDIAVGNVPFGNYRVNDSTYRQHFLIHDYFLAKMIDQVRPGGVVAVITSHGTMDKRDRSARRYLAQKADLVRAIRLPNNAFKSAGTEVTSDILFFRKRERELGEDEPLPDWVNADNFEGDREISINRYFLDHPEDVLGKLERTSTAYGFDVTCKPDESRPLSDALNAAMETMPQVYEPRENEAELPRQMPETSQTKPLSYFIEKGELKFFNGAKVEPVKVNEKDRRHIIKAMEIRDAVRKVIDIQVDGGTDEELQAAQAELNQAYDRYVAAYGHICEGTALKKVFFKDAAYPLLRSLEDYDKQGYKGKTAIFSRRTIKIHEMPTHADTPEDALAISMQEMGKVDLPYMADITDKTERELIADLEYKRIFFDYEQKRYVIAEEYLSGDVREKMEQMERQAATLEREIDRLATNAVLGMQEPPTYSPQNDMEKLIVDHNTDRVMTFSYSFLNNGEKIVDYIRNNTGNHDFMVQVAARQGMYTPRGNPVNNLLADRSLVLLDAIRLGRAVGNGTAGDRLIYNFLLDIKEDRVFDNPESERAQMVYAFLREKVAAYENNAEKIEQALADTVSIDQELVKEWQEFQTAYQERKEAAKQADNPELAYLRESLARSRQNLAALENVKPPDLTAADIHVELGATWIPTEDIEAFLRETLSLSPNARADVHFSNLTGTWRIDGKNQIALGAKAEVAYGVTQFNALALTELALNMKEPKVYKTVYIGGEEKKRINQEATIVAQEKQTLLKQEFAKWIFRDEKRRDRLVAYYNRHFNNIRPREYDGNDLEFPGMNTDIKLREHQKNAIAHTLYGGNTLLAHCVGAGKCATRS